MEIFGILIVIILGIIFGIFAGLIPGIHINLISSFIISYLYFFENFFNNFELILFVISMSVVFTFVSFIPSVLFGVPSSDTSLSILPGHKLVLEGKGYYAIFLSSLGSLFGLLFSFIFILFLFFTLENFYKYFKIVVPYFLISSLIILILTEKEIDKKFWALIVVLFSAGLGMLVLNSNFLSNPLLVLFSGLFGMSTIIFSILSNVKIPIQNFDFKFDFNYKYLKGLLLGGVAASICSITPGIGNAQAATITSVFFRKLTSEIFLFTLSSINTINFILSVLTFYIIDRARNGSIIVVSQITNEITFYDLIFYFSVILVVGVISFFITLFLGKFFVKNILKIDTVKINFIIMIFLFLLVFILTGFYGILVLICSTALGLLCISLEIKRVHLMGVLIVPVILSLI